MKRLVIPMLVAALAAGCGGDDDTTTATVAAPLTKAAFIARADRICTATIRQIRVAAADIRAASEKSGKLPPDDQVARFLTETSLPAYDRMLTRLRALPSPKGDERTIDALIGSLAGAIDAVKANPLKYATTAADDPFDDANARAKRYGMKACGS